MATAHTGTDYLLSHVARYFTRVISAVNSRRKGETTLAHKRGAEAPHSGDTETNCRHQLPCYPLHAQIYVIVFSTSTRVMETNYFPKTYNCWF